MQRVEKGESTFRLVANGSFILKVDETVKQSYGFYTGYDGSKDKVPQVDNWIDVLHLNIYIYIFLFWYFDLHVCYVDIPIQFMISEALFNFYYWFCS